MRPRNILSPNSTNDPQYLRHDVLRQLQVERFSAVHRELRRDAGGLAAAAIGSLLGR